MKMKRLIPLILSLLLLLSMFTGCSKDRSEDKTATETSSSSVEEKKEETKKEDTKKEETKKEEPKKEEPKKEEKKEEEKTPVDPYAEGSFEGYPMAVAEGESLSLWHGSGFALNNAYTSYDESPFHTGLEERLGIDIDYRKPAQGADANQAYNLMIASGDLPDMIYNWGMPAQANDLLNDEYIYELDEYLPVYAPAYWKLLMSDEDKNLSVKTDDGVYYGFAFFREDLVLGTYEGPMIRKDLLDEAGLDVPVTLADWEEALYAFKEMGVKHPLSVWGVGALNQIFTNAYDLSLGYYLDDDNKVQFGYAVPQYKDFLEKMKLWYDEGLLDPDFATNDRAAIKTKVLNDELGATRTSGSTLTGYLPELEAVGSVAEWLPVSYPVANEGDVIKHIQRENNNIGLMAVITTACENVPLACRVLDYGYTEEGMIYWNFGAEGEIMEFIDGKPHFTKEALNDPEGFGNITSRYTGNSANGIGPMMVAMYVDKTAPIAWEACQTWFYTAGPSRNIPAVTATTPENNAISSYVTAISTYASENMIKFIMGDIDLSEFDAYYNEIYGMGLQTVLDIYTQQVDRYFAR
ncbi:MAG: extracellular solute-binding protein [Clostridiales bacterium]|nr:extracellular solute-binding protein [Clostridiales bacterium]